MKILYDSFPVSNASYVALGNFDGVHLGHTRLIETLVSKGHPAVIYTFEKHPMNEILGEGTVLSINTNKEKADIFASMNVDCTVFADFNTVRDMTPEDFVERVLIRSLSAKAVVCGYNYRFGKNGSGDTTLLKKLLNDRGVSLTVVDEVTLDGMEVSSTAVRNTLLAGDMERATELLGRPYFMDSTVVHGKALGRQLGFPTINETFDNGRLILPYGVYFAKCKVKGGDTYIAVVNVGIRPTVNSTDKIPTAEAHIIDFNDDLYGSDVRIEFYKKCRDERKFASLDELTEQIRRDISACKEYFKIGEL